MIVVFRRIIGLVSHLMNAYCFLQFFDGLVVSLTPCSFYIKNDACQIYHASNSVCRDYQM